MTIKPLQILFLASWYPSPHDPHLGNFIQRHAKVVAQQHKVVVLAAFENNTASVDVQQNGNLTEIRVFFIKKRPVFSHLRAMRLGLKKAHETHSFNLAHVHVAYPAGLLLSSLKVPYVVTEHFSGYQPSSNHNWGIFKKAKTLRILNKAKYILPVSEHLGEAIYQFGGEAPHQKISNVVDTSVFKFAAKPPPASFTFLHVSTLEERSKNITGLLLGFKALEKMGIPFILQIGGDGDLAELENKIAEYGPHPTKVEIVPPGNSAHIANKMQGAHAYVMFSHFENQPCTILEALCCGTPVISSNVGGISEELNTENGVLVEAENHEKFVEALVFMLQNYDQYNHTSIAKEAALKYSEAAVLTALNTVYFNVLK